MGRLAGWVFAGVAVLMASPAFAQIGRNQEIGARICPSQRMIHESQDQYERRLLDESDTPDWIWSAVETMQAVPDRMSFEFRIVGGTRVLIATGQVDKGAPFRLETALKRNYPVHEVWFNSPGGDSYAGVEMGDILRREPLVTRVRSGNGCASACSTAFLGGMMRQVEPGAVYGVHMYTTEINGTDVLDQETFNAVQWGGAQGAAERMAYVERMGVSIKWLQLWSGTAPGCMTFMSQDELHDSFVNNLE
jgi:hypothetical protein